METPENFDRAIELLRRQRYHEVADFLEEIKDESNS